MVLDMSQYGISVNAMVSMNEDHRGVGFAHSTGEGSNDSWREAISRFLLTKHRKHRGRHSMEKEKAEIARLVEKYGRVESLMKYVNSDTLKESYRK